MKLSIHKSPDPRFTPYIRRACYFYANELMSKRLVETITLRVTFDPRIDCLGCASVAATNDGAKPRKFDIRLHPHKDAADILETLAHEMVHVRQYARGHLNESLSRWKGIKIDTHHTHDYFSPWEKEAMSLEEGLLYKFKMAERLWEVFTGFSDPSGPVEHQPLGWRVSEICMQT